MNRSIFSIVAVGFALLVGLFVVINALTGHGNTVGQFAKYALIACFFIGLLAPRISIYVLLLMTGYLDLLKRVMVLDLRVSFLDLYYVLGMAPIMLAGVTLGLLIKNVNQKSLRDGHWKVFFGCCGVFAVMVLIHLLKGFTTRSLGNMANNGAYVFLVYALWNVIRDPKDVRRLLLFLIAFYVPVALYTFWQSYNGLSNFELAYLETGLSIESRQFNERIFRPFSTLNAAGNLSVMMGILAVLSLYLAGGYMRGIRPIVRLGLLVLVPIFAYAAFLTYSRGGWVCAVVALVAVFMYGSKFRLVLFYSSGLIVVALVGGFAEKMVNEDTMMTWTSEVLGDSTSDEEWMAKKFQTLNSRLSSIALTVREPKRWRPFGIVVEGDGWKMSKEVAAYETTYFVHDGFSLLLLTIGYIPLFFLMILGVLLMFKIHSATLSLDSVSRRQILLCLGMVIGIATGFSANQAQLVTFPINFYFYFFIGLCIVMLAMKAPAWLTSKVPEIAEVEPSRPGSQLVPGEGARIGQTLG